MNLFVTPCCCPTEPPDAGCKAAQITATANHYGAPTPKSSLVREFGGVDVAPEDVNAFWGMVATDVLPYSDWFGPLWGYLLSNMVTGGFTAAGSGSGTGWNGMNTRANANFISGTHHYWYDFGGGPEEVDFSFNASHQSQHGGLIEAVYEDSLGNSLYIRPNWSDGSWDISGTRAAAWMDYVTGVAGSFSLQEDTDIDLGLFFNAVNNLLAATIPETVIYQPDFGPNAGTDCQVSFSGIYNGIAPGEGNSASVSVSATFGAFLRVTDLVAIALEKLSQCPTNWPNAVVSTFTGSYEYYEDRINLNRGYTVINSKELGSLWSMDSPGIVGEVALYVQDYIVIGGPAGYYSVDVTARLATSPFGGTPTSAVAQKAIVGITGDNFQITEGQENPTSQNSYSPGYITPKDCTANFLPVGTHVLHPDLMVFNFGQMRLQLRNVWEIPQGETDYTCMDRYSGVNGNLPPEDWSNAFTEQCSDPDLHIF